MPANRPQNGLKKIKAVANLTNRSTNGTNRVICGIKLLPGSSYKGGLFYNGLLSHNSTTTA